MPGRGASIYRGGKALACLLCLPLAFVVWQQSSLTFLREAAPTKAIAQDAQDGIALGRVLIGRVQASPDVQLSKDDQGRLTASLLSAPLNSTALVLLAYAAEANGDADQSQKLLELAQRVTRRDVVDQIALIPINAEQGNVSALLRNYHAALSVAPALAPQLLPDLSASLGDERVRSGLQPYVQSGARWMPEFIGLAAQNATVDDLIAFVQPIAPSLAPEPFWASNARLLSRLAEAGRAAEAKAIALAIAPDLDPRVYSDLTPSKATMDPRLGFFAWTLSERENGSASLNEDGSLKFVVQPLARTELATRDIMVRAGQPYSLAFSFHLDDGDPSALLRWRAMCLREAGPIVLQEARQKTSSRVATVRATLDIPKDCAVVRLSFGATGPDDQFSATIRLFDFKFSKKSI